MSITRYHVILWPPSVHSGFSHLGSRMSAATANICVAVLALPHLLAEMTTFWMATTIRRPDTANSRAITTIATQADRRLSPTRDTRAAVTSSLSASGSRNAPITVVCCRRRAMSVSYTHLRAHETDSYLVCRLLLEKKK